jgi:hypothetical protein
MTIEASVTRAGGCALSARHARDLSCGNQRERPSCVVRRYVDTASEGRGGPLKNPQDSTHDEGSRFLASAHCPLCVHYTNSPVDTALPHGSNAPFRTFLISRSDVRIVSGVLFESRFSRQPESTF